MANNNEKERRMWLGIVFVAVGVFLVLMKLGYMPILWPTYLFSWKVLLVGIGATLIALDKKKTLGIWLIAIGCINLFFDFAIISLSWMMRYWPLALVAIGVAMIVGKKKFEKKDHSVNR